MGGQKIQRLAQTVVFPAHRVGLPGHVLHFGNPGGKNLVFRGQRLIAEHIAVILFRRVGEGRACCPEGCKGALDDKIRDALAGEARKHGQSRGDKHGQDQNDTQPGTE